MIPEIGRTDEDDIPDPDRAIDGGHENKNHQPEEVGLGTRL